MNGKPAEILKRSVVRGAAALDNPTVSDAFVVERNKSAAPSLANIAKMAQVSEDQARAELLAKGCGICIAEWPYYAKRYVPIW